MTPPPLARRIVEHLHLTPTSVVLEPSFGNGSFLLPLVERLVELRGGGPDAFSTVMSENVFGVEIDPELFAESVATLEARYGPLPENHGLSCGDFFRTPLLLGAYDFVVGNPPYGGTFDSEIEDALDKKYGWYDGHKLKKETYSFFIAASLDLLRADGQLVFVTSDTFLTIKTMGGLRRRLMDQGSVTLETLKSFSDETVQPTLVLIATVGRKSESIMFDGRRLERLTIEATGNFSWRVDESMSHYFGGPTLGDFIVATGGMTIGDNALFLRELQDGQVTETHSYEFFDDPITLERELGKARLGKLSPKLQEGIRQQEARGGTRRNVRVEPLATPVRIELPHPDYRYYNKSSSAVVYADPSWAVFWKDDGDAVITFKKNGNWYLHGVGGRPFFEREGLSWQLVSQKLNMRFLPAGYILDSGAPCAFLKPGVRHDELWFVLGWCLTSEATRILKTAINHTRNIQGKDVEKLPYPFWLDASAKAEAIDLVQRLVSEARAGRSFRREDPDISKLNSIYEYR